MMRGFSLGLVAAIALSPLSAGVSHAAQPASAAGEFRVEPIAERTVSKLPEGSLYWRIETFPNLAVARAAAGPLSLAAEHRGRAWLFTLGASGGTSRGGRLVVEIGPVPIAPARRYTLRANRAGAPPGAMTPIHSHPGSEVFYLLSGQLSQRTPHGVAQVDAGQAMNGHGADMAMQLTSSGANDLDQLVLFVVDAERPFSSPAAFD